MWEKQDIELEMYLFMFYMWGDKKNPENKTIINEAIWIGAV